VLLLLLAAGSKPERDIEIGFSSRCIISKRERERQREREREREREAIRPRQTLRKTGEEDSVGETRPKQTAEMAADGRRKRKGTNLR
jgi:hypothetical protein